MTRVELLYLRDMRARLDVRQKMAEAGIEQLKREFEQKAPQDQSSRDGYNKSIAGLEAHRAVLTEVGEELVKFIDAASVDYMNIRKEAGPLPKV